MSKHNITYEVARLNIGRVVKLKDRSGECCGTLEAAFRNVMEIRIGQERVVRKRYGEVWDAPNNVGNQWRKLVMPVEKVDATGPVRVHEETAMERAKRLEEQDRDAAKVKAAKQLLAATGEAASLDLLMDRYRNKLAALKTAQQKVVEAAAFLAEATKDCEAARKAYQLLHQEADEARKALERAVSEQVGEASDFLNDAATVKL
jgi:DNA repair ATPase RecN